MCYKLFFLLVTIRDLLIVTLNKGCILNQLDVNNAFLRGDFDEEFYVRIPPSFEVFGCNKACLLKRYLYGLKQASRQWFA